MAWPGFLLAHSQLNLNLKDFVSHFVVRLFDVNEGYVIIVVVGWVKDAAAPVDVFRFFMFHS